MGLIVKPDTFIPGTIIRSAEVNDDFDLIYNEFNGSINEANIGTLTGTIDWLLTTNISAISINKTAVGAGNVISITNAGTGSDIRGNAGNWFINPDGTASFINITFPGATPGSVIFASATGAFSQDNANFFWDDTNNRLGIGTTTPLGPVHAISSGGLIINETNTDVNTAFALRNSVTNRRWNLTLLNSVGSGVGVPAANGFIYSFFNGVSTLNRVLIDQSGQVGIGIFAPTTQLHVNEIITNGGFDFILGNTDQATRGNSGASRALVKNTGNVLHLNFSNDYTGGVAICGGSVTISTGGLITTSLQLSVAGSVSTRTATEAIFSRSTAVGASGTGASAGGIISAKFNIASMVRTAVGNYTVTYTNPVIAGGPVIAIPFSALGTAISARITASTAVNCSFIIFNAAGAAVDNDYFVVVFGS